MTKCVTYFSATGTTRAVAEKLATQHDAQLAEIKPMTPYTSADLNWRDATSRSSLERFSQTRVPMDSLDVSDVHELWIGFPIWWYTCPRIIYTFLESTDFTGKKIHLFATSGGSLIDRAYKDLQSAFPQYDFVDAKKYLEEHI